MWIRWTVGLAFQRMFQLFSVNTAQKLCNLSFYYQDDVKSEVSDEDKLEEEFKSLLQAMEQYLQPITVQLDHVFR